jgi:fructose/tagatose bisphosphate aldolase
MLVSMKELLSRAKLGGYAVDAFDVYRLEGVKGVLGAAQASRDPVVLQGQPRAARIRRKRLSPTLSDFRRGLRGTRFCSCRPFTAARGDPIRH